MSLKDEVKEKTKSMKTEPVDKITKEKNFKNQVRETKMKIKQFKKNLERMEKSLSWLEDELKFMRKIFKIQYENPGKVEPSMKWERDPKFVEAEKELIRIGNERKEKEKLSQIQEQEENIKNVKKALKEHEKQLEELEEVKDNE